MSKGSKQRPTDRVSFNNSWDKIFGEISKSSRIEEENYQLEKAEKEYFQVKKAIDELN
tara:strand:- start:2012 stop:2185 length:174 start_codon:yes stop_codon:yes gene_type:complete